MGAIASACDQRDSPKTLLDTALWQPFTIMKKRQTLRRSIRLPLSLGRRLPGLSADVSRGGFQVEMPQVFLPGSAVDGYFLVDDTEVPFSGTVTWALAGNPQASVYSKMGVKFDALPKLLDTVLRKRDSKKKKLKAS